MPGPPSQQWSPRVVYSRPATRTRQIETNLAQSRLNPWSSQSDRQHQASQVTRENLHTCSGANENPPNPMRSALSVPASFTPGGYIYIVHLPLDRGLGTFEDAEQSTRDACADYSRRESSLKRLQRLRKHLSNQEGFKWDRVGSAPTLSNN